MSGLKRDLVFLSYASEDLDRVMDVYDGLTKRNVTVWFDKIDMKKGKWKQKINDAIAHSKNFVICLSNAAIKKMQENRGVQKDEFSFAFNLAMDQPEDEFCIIPLRLEEDCERGDLRLASYHQYDLFPNVEKALDKLAVDLGGISLSDASAKDERTDIERTIAGLAGKMFSFLFSGEHDKALSLLENVLNLTPTSSDAWNNKGTALFKLGQIEEALNAFNEAIEIKPDNDLAWTNKGRALSELGRHDEALDLFEKAIKIKPDDYWTWFNKGTALSELGRHDEAIDAFNKALERHPSISKKEDNIFSSFSEIVFPPQKVTMDKVPQKSINTVKKILILAANPKLTPPLRLDEEVRDIEEGLLRSKYRDQFDIRAKLAVRLRDIRKAMLDYEPHIVHFIGHGKKEGLLVEDELGVAVLMSSTSISSLFELFSSHVECVILSACYSSPQANIISKHINYVIGMRKEIQDKTAIDFAVGFYDALGAGRSVEEAFKFGCNAIQQRYPDLPVHLIPALKKRKNVDKQESNEVRGEQVNIFMTNRKREKLYNQFKTIQNHTNPIKKILILSANPKATPPLRLEAEIREIEENLLSPKNRRQYQIQARWAVRFRDLRRALLNYEPQIVHFIGHGKKEGLLMEDELGMVVRISPNALSGLFELCSDQVECVFLSACYSVHQAKAISEHIDYVIGIRKEIQDKAAIEFSVGFYDALGVGRSIEEAFEFGRNAILTTFPDLSEHLLPILTKRKDLETKKGPGEKIIYS